MASRSGEGVFREKGGFDARNFYAAPKKAPNYGVAVLGRRLTPADINQRNSTWNIRSLRVICSTQCTFSDVLERYWMVGRVATTFMS
jgi:hypothetical protein